MYSLVSSALDKEVAEISTVLLFYHQNDPLYYHKNNPHKVETIH